MAERAQPETGFATTGLSTTGAAAPAPGPAQDRLADFVHGALIQNIVMADRKAGILFTLVSAALLFLFTRVPESQAGLTGALWVVVVALLVTAAGCAFTAIFPRVRTRGDPLLFWGAMAGQADRNGYVAAVCATEAGELSRRKLGYCHDLACICARKYALLRVAMASAAAGLLLFLALLAMGLPPTAGSGGLSW